MSVIRDAWHLLTSASLNFPPENVQRQQFGVSLLERQLQHNPGLGQAAIVRDPMPSSAYFPTRTRRPVYWSDIAPTPGVILDDKGRQVRRIMLEGDL